MATDPDAEAVYCAEAILEQELPTRELDLNEAQDLVDQISHAEDIDPPKVLNFPITGQYDGLALPNERVIVVRTSRPTQLTIIHEMAHFIGGMAHDDKFSQTYLFLTRHYLSFDHYSWLQSGIQNKQKRTR